MKYSYNKLWKMLIDRHMTKTQMRIEAGISTNILAKMGKDEPIAMDSLAKIASALQCGLDDIVEIQKGMSEKCMIENKQYGVSDATIRNWEKLKTNPEERLTTRANKRKSKKRVLPLEYFSNKDSISYVQEILDYMDSNTVDISTVVLSLGINLLNKAKLLKKENVVKTLAEYSGIKTDENLVMRKIPDDEFDILGLIYQSYLQEGKKNVIGSYYTPKTVTKNMVKDFILSDDKLFLDPCCGSGAFLLSVDADNPNQLFGVDSDNIAVLISKINLLLKYNKHNFIPQIFCMDYMQDCSQAQSETFFNKKFDYIATNPPWGAMNSIGYGATEIVSKESFSYFFVKSYKQLKPNGMIRFLFPESILNVKVHKDIRKFILESTNLVKISFYDDSFTGVTTKYVDIECEKSLPTDSFNVIKGNTKHQIDIKTIYETENLVFNILTEDDISIVKAVKDKGKYSLKDSIWALGIVTGDNKRKLFTQKSDGMEEIYTGKEIQAYTLKPVQKYIVYDRDNLQQVAKEEIYRAPEKLVYKFISNKLVFAYDNQSCLFLNSANILIPKIPSMNIKSVLAFLNSSLFQFMYIKLFGEVKILKGNLMELPFPEITSEEDYYLTKLVDELLLGNITADKIDDYIFSIYGLSEEQKLYIRSTVNGKVNK